MKTGVSNLPLPVPFNPCSHPIFAPSWCPLGNPASPRPLLPHPVYLSPPLSQFPTPCPPRLGMVLSRPIWGMVLSRPICKEDKHAEVHCASKGILNLLGKLLQGTECAVLPRPLTPSNFTWHWKSMQLAISDQQAKKISQIKTKNYNSDSSCKWGAHQDTV